MINNFFKQNKPFLFILAGFIAGWGLYFSFGRMLIKAMYEGRSIGFLNDILEGQMVHPLGFYFGLTDRFFIIANAALFLIFLYFWLAFILLRRSDILPLKWMPRKDDFSFIFSKILPHKGIRNFANLGINAKISITCFFILLFFTILYSFISFSFAKTGIFKYFGFLFGMDMPRVIWDIAEFSGNHYRTKVHPIYVLLVNPTGSLLKMLLHNELSVAIFINSFIGGLDVALAFLFFRIFSKNYFNSLLMSLIFGFSSNQLILSSIPEVGTLAAFSLIIMYILFIVDLETKNINFILWCLAGILTLGVTITNFIQTLICFVILNLFVTKTKKSKTNIIANLIVFMYIVAGITILLAIVQRLIYPTADLFFYSKKYGEELKYIRFMIIDKPWKLSTELIKHFFIVNFIAPIPSMLTCIYDNVKNIRVTFFGSLEFLKVGVCAVALWLVLIAWSLNKSFLSKNKIFFTGAVLCVLFNIMLHSFYGAVEPFIYTGHFTFLVLTFLSRCLFSKNLTVRLLLFTLLILIGVNNLLIMNQIVSVYK